MADAITFRLATAADAPALERLINASFQHDETTEVYLTPDHDDVRVISAAGIETQLARPDCVGLLAIIDGEIAAHANVRKVDAATSWFAFLAVGVAHQNRGLGSTMLRRAEAHVQEHFGARRMEFDVVNTRAGLIAWYKKRGYVETGGTKPFPYEHHGDWKGVLRDDLVFVFFGKELVGA
jgi:ribosomal protein S18 acetylase RimI-like enzyme